jgi:hypothetical protein
MLIRLNLLSPGGAHRAQKPQVGGRNYPCNLPLPSGTNKLRNALNDMDSQLTKVTFFSKNQQATVLGIRTTIVDLMKLPVEQIAANGCCFVFTNAREKLAELRKQLGLKHWSAASSYKQLKSCLRDLEKEAYKTYLTSIIEEIDPALRAILPRLIDLPFVQTIDVNCSGHYPKGDGYLYLTFRFDRPGYKRQVRDFCSLISQVEITDDNGLISRFSGKLNKKELMVRLKRSDSQGKHDPRDEKTKKPAVTAEELIRFWQAFSEIIARFETPPQQITLTGDMFKEGMPGPGFSGGKIGLAVDLQRQAFIDSLNLPAYLAGDEDLPHYNWGEYCIRLRNTFI